MVRTSHIWEDDPVSASIIEKMQLSSSIELEAKDYLRPIFKWTKQGGKSYDVDRANAFAEYLVTVSREGDAARNISCNKSIQAKYAFNILITMAQRRGSSGDAWLSYQRILHHGFEPDVFTMTALIDVIGRSDNTSEGISRAMGIFHNMRSSKNCLPNVITFVTVFRALGKANLHVIDSQRTHSIVLQLLGWAHEISADDQSSLPSLETETGIFATVDITIYNAALSTCVWLGYPLTGLEILSQMAQRGSRLNAVTYKIVSKLVTCYNRGISEGRSGEALSDQLFVVPDGDVMNHFIALGVVTAEEAVAIGKFFAVTNSKGSKESDSAVNTVKSASHSSGQYAGCLGPDAAEDLRQCVIDHDLRKLIERPEGFSESDFATLIHQCRKRKWPNQVQAVLSFMTQKVTAASEEELCNSSTFSPSPSMPSTSHPWLSTESSYNLRRCIVALTWTIYEAAFDAYFCMDMGEEALTLYNLVLQESKDSPALRTQLLHGDNRVFIARGFFRCGRADCAVLAFDSSSSPPSRQLVMGLMHGLGRGENVPVALRILASLFSASCCLVDGGVQSLKTTDSDSDDPAVELSMETPPFSIPTCKVFLVTLLESCAVLGDTEGLIRVLRESIPTPVNERKEKESSFTCLLLRDLIEGEDCDFISVCLMACVTAGDVSLAHEHLHSWQSPPLRFLPPYLFLHSMVAESFAQTASSTSQSQCEAAVKIRSLPFKGFARVGAVRHLDKRRGFIRRTVPKCVMLRGRGEAVADIFTFFSSISGRTGIADSGRVSCESEGSQSVPDSRWRASLQYILDGEGQNEERSIDCMAVGMTSVNIMNISSIEIDPAALGETDPIQRDSSNEDTLLSHYLLVALDAHTRETPPSRPLPPSNCVVDGRRSLDQTAVPGHILSPKPPLVSAHTLSSDETPLSDSTLDTTRDHTLSCMLLLQHLETRLLRVRDKVAKGLLQRQIWVAFSAALAGVRGKTAYESPETDNGEHEQHYPIPSTPSSSPHPAVPPTAPRAVPPAASPIGTGRINGIDKSMHDSNLRSHDSSMRSYARHLVKHSLYAISALDLNGKQSSRLVSTLLDGLDCWITAKAAMVLFDGDLLSDLRATEPCLDVLKELQRMFLILDTIEGAAAVGDILLTLLERDREKLVKVVMFLQQQRLFSSVDLDRLECLLAAALRNSPEGSWSAVMAYMTGMGDNEGGQKFKGRGDNDSNKEIKDMGGKGRNEGQGKIEGKGEGEGGVYGKVTRTRETCKRLVRRLLCADTPTRANSDDVIALKKDVTIASKDDVTIACRLLCKCDLSDDLEFRELFTSIREALNTDQLSDPNTDPNRLDADEVFSGGESYLPPCYPRPAIVWVDGSDMTLLTMAADILLGPSSSSSVPISKTPSSPSSDSESSDCSASGCGGCDVVGIDVEWRPFSTGTSPWPCSVLQVGCRSHCFLFDLLAFDGHLSSSAASLSLSPSAARSLSSVSVNDTNTDDERTETLHRDRTDVGVVFCSLLSSLFQAPSIVKLGFGLAGDFKRLEASYPSCPFYAFSSLRNVTDIALSPLCKGRGLTSVSLEVLGRPLDKRCQLSDWQRRPLLEDQIVYAATDAGVLIAMYDAMKEQGTL